MGSDAGRLAEDYFAEGFYCAESAVLALAKSHGIESPLLPKLVSGLCSGMARTGGPCGALTGAVLGLGLVHGRDHAQQSVQPVYQATQRLIQQFEHEFGAKDCSVLLGCDLGSQEGQDFFRQNQLQQKCCAAFVARAAELASCISTEMDVSRD